MIGSQIKNILWIIVIWTIVSIYQFLFGYETLLGFDCDLSGSDPIRFLLGSIVTGVSAGSIGGVLIVYMWERWLRTKKYGVTLFYIFISYTVTYFLVSLINGFFLSSSEFGLPINHPKVLSAAWSYMQSADLLGYFFWLIIVLGTMIVLQVNDKYGPGVFKDFLLGRYFHPRKEERIFMFLDLRGSTTIAEKLGEEKYFNFIREVFADATPAILKSRGEIYQYVGDEILISWRMHNGLQGARCVECFFGIKKIFLERAVEYRRRYGVVPDFKAGLHGGPVMAGEVGVIKRDIAFSGDVLNTAARIQGECNNLGVDILFSKTLSERINWPAHHFILKRMGGILLRGKTEKVDLMTVEEI